jgi:FixJ family two-component response regulator
MTASITVFVVEHDKTLRQAMSRLMRADGFRAECFESTDALPKKRDWPDGVVVLIVDLDTALRSDELFYKQLNIGDLHPPVICLTGCDTNRTRREAKAMGATSYFRKPVDDQALSDAIIFAAQQSDCGVSVDTTYVTK